MSLCWRCKSLLPSLLSAVYRKPAAATTVIRQVWRSDARRETHAHSHVRTLTRTHTPLAQARLTADRRQVDGRHLDSNRERKMVEQCQLSAAVVMKSQQEERYFIISIYSSLLLFSFFFHPGLRLTQNKIAHLVQPSGHHLLLAVKPCPEMDFLQWRRLAYRKKIYIYIITKCIIYLLYKYLTFINKQSILFNFESCTLFIMNRLSVKCL